MEQRDYFVHESSYLDEPCEIGAGTKFWHFCHLLKNCRIGCNCNIGQNVSIASGLAPSNVGLGQINVTIPAGTPAGSAVPVRVVIKGTPSKTVTVAVR
jgi:UDP-2-acetamido-3-amino-2,3-dideoxy-glucuronate N-acetyltransferase